VFCPADGGPIIQIESDNNTLHALHSVLGWCGEMVIQFVEQVCAITSDRVYVKIRGKTSDH